MNDSGIHDAGGPPPPLPPAVQPPATSTETDVVAGRLTPTWRLVMAATWVAVMAAWVAIWNASVQIGLSTWWLGARGDPQPLIVRLAPFVVAGAVVVAALNRVKATPWIGVAAGIVLGSVALGDIGRVARLALVEGLVALAAIAVSGAALTGRYRRAP